MTCLTAHVPVTVSTRQVRFISPSVTTRAARTGPRPKAAATAANTSASAATPVVAVAVLTTGYVYQTNRKVQPMTPHSWIRPRRCVLAVEGLCFAGKTTLIRYLADTLAPHVIATAEYTDLGPLPPWPPRDHDQVTMTLLHLLDRERARTAAVRTRLAHLPATTDVVVLLDRSPITLIAHEYGMQILHVPANPTQAADLSTRAAAAGHILTPDAYLYLSVPDEATTARRTTRGPVAAHLDHPHVRARIDIVYQSWLRLVPPARVLRLDGTWPLPVQAVTVTNFLTGIGGPSAPPWHLLTGRVPALPQARSSQAKGETS